MLGHHRRVIVKRMLLAGLDAAASAGRLVESVLVPASCVFCGGDLRPGTRPVCAGCYGDLPWLRPAFHLPPFVTALAPLAYAFPVDAAIRRLKFRRKLFYAPALACLLDAAATELPEDIDALLPMPLHWRRQAVRGFNQAAEISTGLKKTMRLPIVKGVQRIRPTPYQSGLSARQRRRNVKQAFRAKHELEYRHVLVVDDVITTGETCRELARVLLDAGVSRVSALAIARAEGA